MISTSTGMRKEESGQANKKEEEEKKKKKQEQEDEDDDMDEFETESEYGEDGEFYVPDPNEILWWPSDEGRTFSTPAVSSSPTATTTATVARANEETNISPYVLELLRSMANVTEDMADTERRIRRAEDDMDEVRRKMGWFL